MAVRAEGVIQGKRKTGGKKGDSFVVERSRFVVKVAEHDERRGVMGGSREVLCRKRFGRGGEESNEERG